MPERPEGQPEGLPEGLEGLQKGPEGLQEGPEGLLEGPEGLRVLTSRKDRRMDVRTDGQTEFLPILQDFVPCRGRCPKNRFGVIF